MSSSIGKLSREEFRRQKDLDAARKAGTAPAAVDEEGNAINPHIPQFMVQAPWYLDSGKPSLKHQRKPEDTKDHVKFGEWYQRGQRAEKAATKYRKGACENCGAMSHKTRDCLERPRKKGAKWTGDKIAADEIYTDLKGVDTDYETKRDRWNGYDPSEHRQVMREYEAVEEARRKMREEEIDKQTSSDINVASKEKKKKGKSAQAADDDDDFGSSDSDEEDEDKYAEKADMVGQKVDTDKRISVRNLRIREDRAKYLYNLDVDSAYYDPKSRSMREAPNQSTRPEDAEYAGDNFARAGGDVAKLQQLQMFSWQSEARGNDVHLQANPTVNELQHREYQQKKEKLNQQIKGSILERYGGAEHFDSVPKELLSGQSEKYVEYTPTGQPHYNAKRVVGARESNGSGSKAKVSSDSDNGASYSTDDSRNKRRDEKSSRSHAKGFISHKDIGEGDVQDRLDKKALKRALDAEDDRLEQNGVGERRADGPNGQDKPDWLKEAESINVRNSGKFRSLKSTDDGANVTEEQLEAFRLKNRNRTEDPMANYRDEEGA